jgi:aldose 1-epimerase
MQQMIGSLTVLAAAGLTAALLAGCASMGGSSCCSSGGTVTREPFGKTTNGEEVYLFTLRNTNGVEARIMTYGGVVVSFKVPDKNGTLGDVTLGFDNFAGYLTPPPYFGALIGRYGNRIAKAQFTLDGNTYHLAANDGVNSLHGGVRGFDKRLWTGKAVNGPLGPSLELTYSSKDGEEGYPGTLKVTALYTVTEENGLRLEFTATTDKDTVLNLTHHSYWNLAGKGTILDHQVMINSDNITPIDSGLIPTGQFMDVTGTPFDFRTPTAIGARIEQVNEQLKFGKGYDHNWVIKKNPGEFSMQARVTEPTSGRVMEVWSTEPGLQFYSGNFLDGTLTGKSNWSGPYQFRNAFCMEPQHFPDSPNEQDNPKFPSVVLKPGQTYKNVIEYKFSTTK